jgi:hypothetical protein
MVQTGALPGFSISIQRQQTFARAGEPITISGRVSGFGLGLPAFVRVTLSGPAHAPEERNFDTIASPLGDYAVQVLAEKDGQYSVRARAGPEPLFLGPAVLESPEPPLAIGSPVGDRVLQDLEGVRHQVPQPPPIGVELIAPITVAPSISLPGLGGGGGVPFFQPLAPPPPTPEPILPAPTAPPPPMPEPQRVSARIIGFEI